MAINVTFTPPTSSMDTPLTLRNISVGLDMGETVNGLDLTDISVSLSSVQITSITGGDGSQFYMLHFTLPYDTNSNFTITIIQNAVTSVTSPSESGPTAAATSAQIFFHIPTPTTGISGGTIIQEANGIIRHGVDTSTSVMGLSKTHFNITPGTGDNVLDELEYWLEGAGQNYTLVYQIPEDKKGSFNSIIKSEVNLRTSSGGRINLTPPMSASTIHFDTRIPYVQNYDMPQSINIGIWDVYIQFNVKVTGLGTSSFIFEGIDLQQPAVYRFTGVGNPFTTESLRASKEDDDAYNTNYDAENTNTHNKDSLETTVGNWTQDNQSGNTTESEFFLVRFRVPNNISAGTFSLSLKQGEVKGPVIVNNTPT